MATTTNYSWTTPDNTAYVKDGASAIRTLGSAVDSTLYTINNGSAKVGMHLLNTTSFSSAANITISNVFTTTYDSYKIIFWGVGSASAALLGQLTLSGTPAATNYTYALIYANDTGGPAKAASGAGATTNQIGALGQYTSLNEILINRPALADNTTFMSNSLKWVSTTSYEIAQTGSMHYTPSAYDGIKLIPSSGTMTGNVRIYGLRNS